LILNKKMSVLCILQTGLMLIIKIKKTSVMKNVIIFAFRT